MEIFEFTDYKRYIQERVAAMPRRGRGEYLRIAEALRINSSFVSQVLRGSKDFTLEQASALADYLGLNELEAEYLVVLVSLARAGTPSLRTKWQLRLAEIRRRAEELVHRISKSVELSDEGRALFYSNWFYSGVRLLTSIDGFSSIDEIAAALGLPKATINAVVEFLLAHGLCVKEDGRLMMGPKRTHVPASSPLVGRHHTNWRLKALEHMTTSEPSDLFFTSPMTLSRTDKDVVRREILTCVKAVSEIVDASPSEELVCWNVDLFTVAGASRSRRRP